jgi:glycosyltransferase involved in cell wall biosynthesis
LSVVTSTSPHVPLVSLVIPAYNASEFIERTLVTARDQSYANIEIIVIDDGSTDNTRELVDQAVAVDSRIRIISTTNMGVAAARNRGIAEATGDLVAFLDADDIWHPSKIEKQVALLATLPEDWGAVYSLYYFIDNEDRIVREGNSRTASGYILARHASFRFISNGSALLVRKAAAVSVGGFDPSYAAAGIGGCEDLDFELRLFARYKAAAIPERLVGYREYAGNMSSDYYRMSRSMKETIERCLRREPVLSDYAKSSARAIAESYSMVRLAKSRRFGEATRCALKLTLTEPLLLLHRLAAFIRLEVLAKLSRSAEIADRQGVRFADIPAETVPAPRDPFWERSRMAQLAAEDAILEANCQSAWNIDPLSASNFDPPPA